MEPIQTVHLFPVLDEHLLALLRGLRPEQWELPTVAPRWRVRDVALHLLDGNLRALSMLRDGYFGQAPAVTDYAGIVQFLDGLNSSWVQAGQRLSPAVITWLLELSGPEYNQLLASLDPQAPAAFSVAWAGELESRNWFHVARDYTEKWHHQQQIRQAVGEEQALLKAELYHPFLQTCLRAWPWHYRHVAAPEGTQLGLCITGEGGGDWHLRRQENAWQLEEYEATEPSARITLDGSVAWRLFTKSLPRAAAEQYVHLEGDPALTEPFFSLLTIMG
ncbi:maleylpyruvate isomerase N-terminal domain-containing protein [Hymenobacter guriensis]|uniref:Maleylpyruvate isomerase N-terminal domain-containing protein n=1 Tax=Hymenobacter guriensis TaxID=2793065 RepID=A0ABS0L452_9BACT|nr:maleylpyruvate isomerase N-terminal domain-containing protein [Hymenobacter guriensis]MBG8554715.1 maleylpyruvate isomerase N-terminal domain-containing protein [Hymenobacter guriensis]